MTRFAVAMAMVVAVAGCVGMDDGEAQTEDRDELAAVASPGQDEAALSVLPPALSLTATATPSYQRRYTWTMTVTPPPPVTLASGESRHVPFGVEITNTGTIGSGHAVDGVLTLANSGRLPLAVAVLVAYAGEVSATVTCPSPVPFVIASGASVRCSVRATLPNSRSRSLVALAIPTTGAPALAVTPFSFSSPGAVVSDLDRVVEATASGVGHVYLTDARFEPHVTTTYHRLIGPYTTCGPFTSTGVASLRAVTAPDSARSGLLMLNVPANATGAVPCI
jgi:hypothetical protein